LINKRTHTKEDADRLLDLIHIHVSSEASLIGSFGRGKISSLHDIDILIPNIEFDDLFKERLIKLLNAKTVEPTDWGGLYFSGTDYGNVDVFYTTEDFDY
jgi:predicted nucleotidyltransferase